MSSHSKYSHLFFDLDHTLWDFESNSRNTLVRMFQSYQLEKITGVTAEQFYSTYIAINDEKWRLYSQGKITKQMLREQRFPETFGKYGFEDLAFSKRFETEYMMTCPHQTQLMPGTIETLDYLKGRYSLHIITNGFVESQDIKLNKSGIAGFFENVFSSELIGANKPSPLIFEESLRRAGAATDHSLMIGDNLMADVLGARSSGLDQVYYNPEETPHDEAPTFEVSHLLQLKSFL